jgi:ribosomal protein L11 methyltransferase
VAEVEGDFDLVVANILSSTLIELAPGLVARTAPGGLLTLSGVLAEQGDEVIQSLRAAALAQGRTNFDLRQRRRRGEWLLLVLGVSRPAGTGAGS